MRLLLAMVAGLVVLAGCECGKSDGTDGGDAGRDGGDGGPGAFAIFTLDPDGGEATYLAMASDPAQERVGVAYYAPAGTTDDAGSANYDVDYVEWKQGVTSPIEHLRTSQRKVGIAVAFNPSTGEPVASYLGGAPGFQLGQSIFWFQSDAVLNTRSAGTWTESIIAADGNSIGATNSNLWQDCSNTISSKGFLVGLWAALVFDSSSKAYLAWRNGHNAQDPQQDWAGSDVNLAEGALNPSTLVCVSQGGNFKQAYGGRISMAMGPNNQPAMIWDQTFGSADALGKNVYFQRRNADGSWTSPGLAVMVGNTQTGASLAYDAQEGYGIAVVERSTNQLRYVHSADGVTWSDADEVFGSGSGGWYPSLAMDPINHEPAIAFYVCSPRPNATETSCQASDDELRLSQRVAGTWREVLVDPEGGYGPRIGFFSSGKRFVVYRHPRTGAVKLAVER